MKVAIRTDASLRIGTGHVMRCLTLANALKEKGAEVSFICRDHEGNLIDRIQSEGFEVYTLSTRPVEIRCHSECNEATKSAHNAMESESPEPKLVHTDWLGVSQQQDASDCRPVLEEIKPDWLIVDHYAIDQAWQSALKPYYQKLMVIDDLGDRHHLCDLLLDQNYGSTKSKYQGLVPQTCKVLAGADYALLRPEFAQWRKYSLKRRVQDPKIKTILVTLGGVDPDNYTGKVLQQLAKMELDASIEIVIVMGATAPNLASIQQQAEKNALKTTIKTNVSNMAEIMANADLAIGAAGATTWERCCLGLPTIQLVIAENQRQIALALAKDNIIVLMEQVEELPGLVESTKANLNAFSERSANAANGLGCQRVVESLQGQSI